jgi:transcription-repair coupling factor (superfamily II helicase)
MFAKNFDLDAKKLVTLAGSPFGHHARIAAEIAGQARPRDVLFIAADDISAATTVEIAAFFNPHLEMIAFPAWDCLPYDRVSPSGAVMAQRAEALTRLLSPAKAPRLVITTVPAVMQKVPAPSVFRDISLAVHTGDTVDTEKMRMFLASNGYARVDTVREPGEYAFRGSIIDLYPPGEENPLRLDLFGDEVEAIRRFDPLTQRTVQNEDALVLKAVSEVLFNETAIARFRSGYRTHFGVTANDPLYESVSAGRKYPGMEHWLPLFHERMVPLTDYLKDPVLLLDPQMDEAVKARGQQIDDFYTARKALQQADKKSGQPMYRPLPVNELYLMPAEWESHAAAFTMGQLSPFPAPEADARAVECGGVRVPGFAEARSNPKINVYDAVREALAAETQRHILLACYSQGSADRLMHVLKEHGVTGMEKVESYEAKAGHKIIRVGVLPLEHGFIAPDLLVYSESDILGDRLSRPKARRGKADEFTLELSALSEGDLVVHNEHGIGCYMGLETLDVTGAPHDCLRIVYEGGDRLYVPVENLDILSRYGSHSDGVQLDRLGSVAWQGRKARVKKRLKDMADALLKIAAERQIKEGERIIPPEGLYDEFAARFPYAETEDQERAIGSVFEDLASGRPMDRLVCGDVGFGKTEVAIRAAFAAVQQGFQVAVVVPTTLLARQHFRTFSARFAGMPYRLAQLSRLVTAKETKENKLLLADGKVDIVVGTHAILAKDVKFKNLGLLIVDEEQHFGVKQKEKLKELRANVHVLTLTATPIPRTLQLALAGVRELSLIATPPVDRLAVRTFVLPYDGLVIREALMREHYRGGQSFYVCPRIEDLGPLREKLQELVPEIRIVSAHGRLTPTELEDVMTAFDEGKYDVLLATNIVESGLDIPNANTIILHRADMFGLAQLYQLRGRVGRAKQRGYAYFTYDPSHPLTQQAQARLEILATLEGLGAGFQLASHDLDLRGAGNLLGEEQSGQIREVGIELYQQMLEEAVASAKLGVHEAANQDENWTPQINLGMSVLIPETYVADLGLRLNLYRRAADLADREAIESFAAELIDRFGALPSEVQNLLETVAIKQLCRRSGVERLDAGPKGAVIAFRGNSFAKPDKLVGYIQKNSGTLKVRPDQKLSILRVWDDAGARLKGVEKILNELAGLAA